MRNSTWCATALAVVIALSCEYTPGAEPPTEPGSSCRPWIGITSTIDDRSIVCRLPYVRAVRQAGGVPVIIPVMGDGNIQAEYLRRLDGLVLVGGGDVPPEAYGEKPHPTVKVMPRARWQWERRLAHQWLESDKPLLGVCLGAQMTNVVAGGSLIQDIPSQVGGRVVHRDNGAVEHMVTIEPDSRLHGIVGADRARVRSWHHQAVNRVGKGLRVVARSDDGVIEALEMPGDRWVLLVQWHPEGMTQPHGQAVYDALITACQAQPASSK